MPRLVPRSSWLPLLVLAAGLASRVPALAAQVSAHAERRANRCTPDASGLTASAWLARAMRSVGMTGAAGRVAHYRGVDGVEQNYQSDRTYPPFFSAYTARDVWLDPATGVERLQAHTTYIGADFASPPLLSTSTATWQVRDSATLPAAASHRTALETRALDPWAVLHDWSAGSAVAVEASCEYRDYARVVLRRDGAFGAERLFLASGTAFPVKLDRTESHYLWGQQHVEYVYSDWSLDAGVAHPGAAFRVADGDVEVSRTVSTFVLVPPDSAPRLATPARAGDEPMALQLPGFLQALPADTARVGAHAFVLRNPGYGETVALLRDTVFVLDATQSENRARQDSAWIGRLFPGRHPVVLVVTDLAWPHVGGLRFWVASGATVVSHRSSRAFLERVLARRWTAVPDKLERLRRRPPLRLRAVNDSLALAGGDVGVYAIDGPATEGALVVYLRPDRFLWAGDNVQDLSQPTIYATEVARAAARAGLAIGTLAGEHLPTAPWATLLKVNGGTAVEGG